MSFHGKVEAVRGKEAHVNLPILTGDKMVIKSHIARYNKEVEFKRDTQK